MEGRTVHTGQVPARGIFPTLLSSSDFHDFKEVVVTDSGNIYIPLDPGVNKKGSKAVVAPQISSTRLAQRMVEQPQMSQFNSH